MLTANTGGLLVPNLHDGYLDGFYRQGQDLIILVRDVGGDSYTITLPKTIKVYATDFLQGNIILTATFYTGSACPPYAVHLANWCIHGDDDDEKERVYQDFVNSNWSLLEIQPSYGCELYAIFSVPLDKVLIVNIKT